MNLIECFHHLLFCDVSAIQIPIESAAIMSPSIDSRSIEIWLPNCSDCCKPDAIMVTAPFVQLPRVLIGRSRRAFLNLLSNQACDVWSQLFSQCLRLFRKVALYIFSRNLLWFWISSPNWDHNCTTNNLSFQIHIFFADGCGARNKTGIPKRCNNSTHLSSFLFKYKAVGNSTTI